jgi:hypothetical protein
VQKTGGRWGNAGADRAICHINQALKKVNRSVTTLGGTDLIGADAIGFLKRCKAKTAVIAESIWRGFLTPQGAF